MLTEVYFDIWGGEVYAMLPSQKSAFRAAMEEIGAESFPAWRPAWVFPHDKLPDFKTLVGEYYPHWSLSGSFGVKPWITEGILYRMAEESLGLPPETSPRVPIFQRISAGLVLRGAEVDAKSYNDGSLHLHVGYGERHLCLIFESEVRFKHARLGDHDGIRVENFLVAMDYLNIPQRERA